jgi:hypothetical protein
MSCVNCETDGTAYTLRAHVPDSDAARDLPFCSAECLEDWVTPRFS